MKKRKAEAVKRKTKTRLLAEQIAAKLFWNYEGNQVERLVLTDDLPEGPRDYGGWCETATADRIEATILRAAKGGTKGKG